MTISNLICVLYSRKFFLLGVFFAIVSAGMTVTFLLPPTYQSTMKILITRDRVDPQVTPAEKMPDFTRGGLTEEDFNSEIEILQSRSVLEGVARQIGFDKQYAERPQGWFARFRSRVSNLYRSFHHQAAPSPMELAVAGLRDSLDIVSVKKSRVIRVTCNDSNAERAAQVLNELYRQYAEHHLRLLQNSKAANVFHEQSAAFAQKLRESTEALKRFDAQTGVTANAAQQGLLQQQLYEAQNQLDKTRTEIREAERRIAALKAQIQAQPERIESEARTKYVAALDKIKDEILTLELQRTQLLQKYQPNNRQVSDVEKRLAQAREMLEREEKSPPQERAVVLNEVHRSLTSEMLLTQANLATLREREQSLAALAVQYRERVANFDARILERANLERERAVNEEAYLLYHKKAQEADIINALNQERIVNFSLTEAPSVNHRQVNPKPLINLAALMFVGLVAAIAIVAFIERSRLFFAEANLLGASQAGLPPPTDKDHALASAWAAMLASGGRRQLTDGNEDALNLAGQSSGASGAPMEESGVNNPESDSADGKRPASRGDSANNNLKALRVKAVVEYLHGVYRMPSDKLSEVLRKTAGWEISPAEIDEMLSSDVKR